jgi:hypothetical protein
MRRRLPTAALLIAALLAAGACGHKEERVLQAETEGVYLTLGELIYQVQISRLLNPQDAEDRAYFVGIDPAERELEGAEQWFAVFMRVQNEDDQPHPAAEEFEIEDTAGNRYEPVEFAEENVFAYRAGPVPGDGGLLPAPSSAAAESTIQGSLVLFKIPAPNLENRPLALKIRAGDVPGQEAEVDLDV